MHNTSRLYFSLPYLQLIVNFGKKLTTENNF